MKEHHPNLLSASTMVGDNVVNSKGENLGEIKELMVDLESGRIVYAVLSFGGFLGMGDKLFAVPWEALAVRTEEKVIELDVDKEVLEGAPGFDKSDWPSQPDRSFVNKIYTHYGYEPYYSTSAAASYKR